MKNILLLVFAFVFSACELDTAPAESASLTDKEIKFIISNVLFRNEGLNMIKSTATSLGKDLTCGQHSTTMNSKRSEYSFIIHSQVTTTCSNGDFNKVSHIFEGTNMIDMNTFSLDEKCSGSLRIEFKNEFFGMGGRLDNNGKINLKEENKIRIFNYHISGDISGVRVDKKSNQILSGRVFVHLDGTLENGEIYQEEAIAIFEEDGSVQVDLEEEEEPNGCDY